METNIIKTPRIDHIKSQDWEFVYQPAEDTFLLLDTLERELEFIRSRKPNIILEVGSGSGVIITGLSKVLNSSTFCLAIDVNPHACKITKSTANHNNTNIDVIQGDLTSCLKKFSVDMIIFNPPYVVTPSNEVNSKDCLTKSWAGGIDGREVINRFLSTLAEVVNEKTFGYILLLKENKPYEVMKTLREKQFSCDIVSERKIQGEELFVIRFFFLN